MIKAKYIKDNKEEVIEALRKRLFKNPIDLVDNICVLYNKRLKFIQEKESYIQRQKEISDNVQKLFKNGDNEKAEQMIKTANDLKNKIELAKGGFTKVENKLDSLLIKIPNIPQPEVPVGESEADNIYMNEPKIDKDDSLLPHWELSDKYDLIDFKKGVKLTGAGFPVYKGKCAKLQRALIQFFLDEASEEGYEEVQVPHLVNHMSCYGTGQIPDKDGQMYHCVKEGLYLIPTAEIPITNLYRDEIVSDLPIKHVGYTPCFRREAGSYGSNVKGLNRLHQFDKVEIVQIVEQENSNDVLVEMCAHVEKLLNLLDLKFRRVLLCTGDLGFTSSITYDYEVYSPGQDKWLEVSSVSNFQTFQSNRLNLRYKDENGKKINCHTLNGSALALPRILATILESYQDDTGIDVPFVLQKYLNFTKID